MGGVDWEGIGQGTGDIGRQLVAHREQTIAKREREAEKQRVLDDEARERSFRAAEAQWRLTQHLPEGDPQRERAAAAYEAAARAYFKSQSFAIPKKTVGAKPAEPPVTIQQGAPGQRDPKVGEPVGPQTVTMGPGRPGKEVYDMPGAEQQQVDEERLLQSVRQFQNSIANSKQGAGRAQALAQAEVWKKAILTKYPQLAHLIPDFSQTAALFDDEDRRVAAAKLAQEGQAKWAAGMAAAQKQFEAVWAKSDPIALISAIKSRRALAAAGKAAGYTDRGALDDTAQLSEIRNLLTAWASKITDINALYVILPVLQQYGIKPTPNQQKLLDIMLKTKQKAAAPRGSTRKATPKPEDTGF